jgi:hypothetical protein
VYLKKAWAQSWAISRSIFGRFFHSHLVTLAVAAVTSMSRAVEEEEEEKHEDQGSWQPPTWTGLSPIVMAKRDVVFVAPCAHRLEGGVAAE